MKILKELSTAKERLTYSLTLSEMEGIETYGIKVTTTLFGDSEEDHVDHITSDYDFAEKLLYILADNTVLPSTLREVVEDYVATQFTVYV